MTRGAASTVLMLVMSAMLGTSAASPAGATTLAARPSRAGGAALALGTPLIGYTTSSGVFEVHPDGTQARRVPGTDAGSGSPAWSHDGNVVAYTETASPALTTSEVGLATVVADGSCRTAFANTGHGVFSGPAWSRDGSHLAYVYAAPGQASGEDRDIEVSRSDGTGAAVVAGGFSPFPAAWAPDGSGRLLYSDTLGLHVVDTTTGASRVLDATTDTEFAVWSPDGRRVAYSISTQPALWVVNADGTGRRHLTPVNPPVTEDFFPAWSPDGSKIAFGRSVQGSSTSGQDIWVINADGSGARAVTSSHTASGAGPLWSPDGTMIAYNEGGAAGPDAKQDVWVVGANGANPHLVASSAQLAAFFTRTVPVDTAGYRMADASGAVSGFGTECSLGSRQGGSSSPVVAMASTTDGGGYWLATADGGVSSFGDAAFHGSLGRTAPAAAVVAMAATPDGGGYWLASADGGVNAFGDAGFFGSMAGRPLNGAIVGLAPSVDGHGYWLVGADGGVFSFGDAQFEGSSYTDTPASGPLAGRLATPIVGMSPTADGHGYWLVAAGGGVFTYGRAPYLGSMGGLRLNRAVVGITTTRDRGGYWLTGADGGVFSFGDASFRGVGPLRASPVIGLAR